MASSLGIELAQSTSTTDIVPAVAKLPRIIAGNVPPLITSTKSIMRPVPMRISRIS